MVKIALIWSRIRRDERMLIDAAEARGVTLVPIDDRELVLPLDRAPKELLGFDAVLERGLSYHTSYYVTRALQAYGIPCVNPHDVLRACGDKAETSFRLAQAGIDTPQVHLAFDEASGLRAFDAAGYPAVAKPVVGSWGRLVTRVPDRDTAAALLEHKRVLGGPQHQVTYAQEHIDKPGRDIRAFWIGGRTVAAIHRENAEHFLTNTARGGRVTNRPVDDALDRTCGRIAEAIGGGMLAIDLMERPDGTLTCHEVNHTMEFKNSVAPTGVDIPAHVIDHVVEVAKGAAL